MDGAADVMVDPVPSIVIEELNAVVVLELEFLRQKLADIEVAVQNGEHTQPHNSSLTDLEV